MINPDLNIHMKEYNIRRIVEAVSELDRADQISTVDWWDDDLVATGFIKKERPEKVVYVLSMNRPKERYAFDCDVYHSDDPADFTTMVESDDASLDETVKKIEEFLLGE